MGDLHQPLCGGRESVLHINKIQPLMKKNPALAHTMHICFSWDEMQEQERGKS
jgi:hypothetical protein